MKNQTVLVSILKALIPYTRENLLLSFKPSKFFYELERSTGYSKSTLNRTYGRAIKRGLITDEIVPRLTAKGRLRVAPFVAKQLSGTAQLMIIFDIPEHHSILRSRLRRLLKNLAFKQIQKSVWVTEYDYREVLCDAILEFDLQDYVQLYECASISPNTRPATQN